MGQPSADPVSPRPLTHPPSVAQVTGRRAGVWRGGRAFAPWFPWYWPHCCDLTKGRCWCCHDECAHDDHRPPDQNHWRARALGSPCPCHRQCSHGWMIAHVSGWWFGEGVGCRHRSSARGSMVMMTPVDAMMLALLPRVWGYAPTPHHGVWEWSTRGVWWRGQTQVEGRGHRERRASQLGSVALASSTRHACAEGTGV